VGLLAAAAGGLPHAVSSRRARAERAERAYMCIRT